MHGTKVFLKNVKMKDKWTRKNNHRKSDT
uniref:Uncharacterized protein n=1 Tax=Rhizophora mucronata TaxID=61149 RepID=A0A2P2PGW8_RHIMU